MVDCKLNHAASGSAPLAVARVYNQSEYLPRRAAALDRWAEALEAAHITPYRGEDSHHPQNGLLLRADLHSLFDLGLIAIDGESMTVKVASGLADTEYGQFAGQMIIVPADDRLRPSPAALDQHRLWAGL